MRSAGPDNRLLLFLTEHAAMPVDEVRFLFRLLDAMSAVGYRVGMLNLGEGAPRPLWYVPPYVTVSSAEELHSYVSRTGPRVTIGTTWRTAYHAFSDATANGGDALFLAGGEPPDASDPRVAWLLARAYAPGRTLTWSPRIAALIEGLGSQSPTITLPVEDALLESVPAQRRSLAFPASPDAPEAELRAARATAAAAETLGGVPVRSLGYGLGPQPPVAYERVVFDWTGDDSFARSRALAEAACFISAEERACGAFAIAQAMAAGCPVVAVRSAATEGLCDDGVDCVLVESAGHTDALADAVVALAADDERTASLTSAARKKARAHTWQACLDSLPDTLKAECRPERARGIGAVRWEPDDAA